MTTVAIVEGRGIIREARDGDRSFTILNGIDLELGAGERVALLGPSGSGKSTLLHILGGLDREFEGSVRIAGHQLATLNDDGLARLRNDTLGFVFQTYNLLGHLDVMENVLLPAEFGRARPEPRRAASILERVGLAEKAKRFPRTLSGGERQRVAIARALYNRPQVVLCDEPTGNLDDETTAEILVLFEHLTEDGTALLIATHDHSIAETADRVLVLRSGELT